LQKDKDLSFVIFTTIYQHVGLRSIQPITATDRNKRTVRKEKVNPLPTAETEINHHMP